MNDIRKGTTVVLDGQPYLVLSAEFLKKQQGRPVVRTTLRHLQTGAAKEHTFMQSDKIEQAEMTRAIFQFLYREGETLQFMDQGSFEQISIGHDVAGEAARFLIEGQEVAVLLFEDRPVAVELPIKIDRTVITAPPGVKGDTSTNVMKEVVIEGETKVKAPLFVKEGDRITIDTRSGEYVARA